jgi:hypothetical protein
MINFDTFDVIAFVVYVVTIVAAVVIIVLIGGLPGQIARHRGHPQATAVAAAGWIGIATMGLLWPVAFIWAFMRLAPPGPVHAGGGEPIPEAGDRQAQLRARVEALEADIRALQNSKGRAT